MTTAMADRIRNQLGHASPMFEIPAAGHHVLLDEPLCLVTALRAVLAGWVPPSASVTPDASMLAGVGDV
jgi:pimeloyl-ACP methyl ester carboxylesterase